ncbi:MAG: hypothetical protein HC876_08925 [Chloroflexaceae bacterium]|nr:hypothetical protein [Chloroflexaceae bacterium]
MSTPSHPQVNRGTTVAAPRPLRLPVAVHNVRAVVQQPIILATLLGLLSLLVTMMALAQPWRTSIIVGSPFDRPYLREFYHAEYSEIHQSGFRWTQPVASVILQGLDQGTVVVLHVHGDYDGMPLGIDNGAGMQTVALRPGWQQVYLLPRVNAWNGNTFIRLNAPAQFVEGDPRARGVAVRQIDIRGNGAMPPLGQAVLLALSTALATLLMGRATHRTWMGALVGLSLALGVGAVLTLDEGYWRLTLTNYTGRLLVVLLLGGLVLLAAEWLLACLVQRGIIRLGPGARRGLAAAALLAFVMRFGAAAYPLNYNSDLPLILGRTWLVREGQLLSIFLPNPALTPVQWEMDVTIPRSPFYYIITTPVTLLPSRYGDELGMLAFSSVVDAVAVLLVGMLVLALGGNGRAAVYGGLLAAALPFGLRMMVSWGILPTLLAQCLSLLAVMVWLHLRPRLHKRWAQLVLGVCLAVAFIAYPTALVFLGTTGALLIALLALRRDLRPCQRYGRALVRLWWRLRCFMAGMFRPCSAVPCPNWRAHLQPSFLVPLPNPPVPVYCWHVPGAQCGAMSKIGIVGWCWRWQAAERCS